MQSLQPLFNLSQIYCSDAIILKMMMMSILTRITIIQVMSQVSVLYSQILDSSFQTKGPYLHQVPIQFGSLQRAGGGLP